MPPERWLALLGRGSMVVCLLPAAATLTELVCAPLGVSPFAWLEATTGPLCHHDPVRTLPPSPVCARCTGLAFGAAFGGLLGTFAPLHPHLRRLTLVTLGATAVGGVAALAEAAGWIATPNVARLGLGAALGVGVPTIGALGGRLLQRAPRG